MSKQAGTTTTDAGTAKPQSDEAIPFKPERHADQTKEERLEALGRSAHHRIDTLMEVVGSLTATVAELERVVTCLEKQWDADRSGRPLTTPQENPADLGGIPADVLDVLAHIEGESIQTHNVIRAHIDYLLGRSDKAIKPEQVHEAMDYISRAMPSRALTLRRWMDTLRR